MTQSNPAFPTLSEKQIAAIAQFATRRHFRDGDSLFQAGTSRGAFFVILSGAVEIVDNSGGQPRSVVTHLPGQFTGDIDILSRRRTVVSGIARADTDALEVAPADIRRIISDDPGMGEIILQAFIARREQLLESGFQGIRVIGSGSSRDAYRIREFLTRNHVPATWIDVDQDPHAGEMLEHFGFGDDALPVVACEGRPLMHNPSISELAEAVGLRGTIGTEIYDLVIIGAGPAGLAAAVYGSSEGLSTLLLDSEAPGGQASASTSIENYLGFPMGISGADLTNRATLQSQKFGTRFSIPSPVTALEDDGSHIVVRFSDGEGASTRCVLIATGADYRKLDVPDRERFEGLGVYYSATAMELAACGGADVVIVGAGNSAGQAAMFLARHTNNVLLLVRGDNLRKNMSSYLADRVEAAQNIELLYHSEIRKMEGATRLERVEIENTKTGEKRTVTTPAVFTFIGAVPRTDWLPPQIETDPKGFICTGRTLADSTRWTKKRAPFLLETSHPGVFAAGDVRLGSAKRVASAVGEGSMAVMFVHEYLAELNAEMPAS